MLAGREPAEARADDGAGAAGGFRPAPDGVRGAEDAAPRRQGRRGRGITAALRGAGGYGKTTLAKALAHDPDIQDAYFDGILWAELGEKPERLLSILSDLIELLTGERPGLETINAAAAKLGEALGDRRILLIVDDAWREQDLQALPAGRAELRPARHDADRQRPAAERRCVSRSTPCRRAKR